jgi:hypothetical protein
MGNIFHWMGIRKSIRLAFILALGLLSLGNPLPAYADGFVVSDCGDTGDYNQLRTGLELSRERDYLDITFTCTGTIVLTQGPLPSVYLNLTIDGGNDIILSGNEAGPLFGIQPGGSLTLKNITITHGYFDGDGGAIINNGTLNIIHSEFLDNGTSQNGNGGVIVSIGELNIADSKFHHNRAANGGALYLTGGGSITTITGSKIYNNEATSTTYGWGGAIYMSAGARVTIRKSSLSANNATDGGAVFIYYTASLIQLQIENSTLDENWVSDGGGGIYNAGGSVFLTNVTLSRNSGMQFAGGIYSSGDLAEASLTNVTMSENWANIVGGIYNEASQVSIINTVIAKGQHGENCYTDVDHPFEVTSNLSDDLSCGFGAGRDNVADLLLGPLGHNGGPTLTHMPLAGSLVRDNATGVRCPPTDQRGASRSGAGTGSNCDVGSVEYGASLPWAYIPFIVR